MKKLWTYLRNHLKEDFNPKLYGTVAVLLIILITFNYHIDFEDKVLNYLTGYKRFFGFFFTFSIPYFITAFLYTHFKKRKHILKTPAFWVTSIFGLVFLSLDTSLPFLMPLIREQFPLQLQFWIFKVSVNLISFITVLLPCLLFYLAFEKENTEVYGLAPKKFDAKPYFVMLLIMLPLLLAASGTKGFQQQYPMYKTSAAHTYLGVDEWLIAGGYELAYGLDFITVEFMFRGFFVLALAPFLGRGSVLCMAVIYCILHFGKPMGESISSIFGGFILGIFAYETRSIWGGIIVHMGIAWMMEAIAYITKEIARS